ncbi:MAG TPA: carboxypeptidase regulatory-like domain-containing protein [candidate division Zixibacteria bacterium]|nr:carboxypeptidase regulatory-like domain-containing protein [candidate division Zixibacteria bacterium]
MPFELRYVGMTIMKTSLGLLLAAMLCLPPVNAADLSTRSRMVTGVVVDTADTPIPGATVSISKNGGSFAGAASNDSGRFNFRIPATDSPLTLTCSAIGFDTWSEVITPGSIDAEIRISLQPKSVEISGITVRPAKVTRPEVEVYGKSEINAPSKNSLVSNNPIDVVREPQVVRQGSAYSSKLRINGTIPTYYLNGIPIGSDPNHYGMFSIIPAPAVGRVAFHGSGTSAAFEVPATLELSSPVSFGRHFGGSAEFSFVQATASFSVGTDKTFTTGTVRKSVLDKLVKQFAVSTDRRTLPPTNFQDIFLSSGWQLSNRNTLFLDQYYTRDYLAYDLGATMNHPDGLYTYQHMSEEFQGLRLLSQYGKFLLTTTLGRKVLHEQYQVYPPSETNYRGLRLDLTEHTSRDLAGFKANFESGRTSLLAGTQLEYITGRSTGMSQQNWNFLPPDANSDNPNFYQYELNQLYGGYSRKGKERNAAGFASVTQDMGAFRLESGIRLEQFGNLSENRNILLRERLSVQLSDADRVSLYAGTFAENPVKRILEPYQVLVRANLAHLTPVKTKLLSATFAHKGVRAEIFAKRVAGLPVLSPDYSAISTSQAATTGFIQVTSSGSARFYGADISFDWNRLLSRNVSLYASYGYTHGVRYASNVAVPYDLTAPHKFQLDIGYQPTRSLHLNASLSGHTGYPYTPTFTTAFAKSNNRYSAATYEQYAGSENSVRFPVSMSLNLSAGLTFDRLDLFLNVTNVTNRGNPIINTADGYVYDAGLFPSLGMKVEF